MNPTGDVTSHEVTELLNRWGNGDRGAFDALLPLVYKELHKIAKRGMAQQDPGNTLQTTALIHEAYLKLIGGAEHGWENRRHFFSVAAKAIRHILVDHARERAADKRGGGFQMVPLDEPLEAARGAATKILALEDAMKSLEASYPRQAQVVELRHYCGFSVEETAQSLQVSPETVGRDWRFAKSFLRREMSRGGALSTRAVN
jgi:RNA polymerase sigma factor (TIGR02999 family)